MFISRILERLNLNLWPLLFLLTVIACCPLSLKIFDLLSVSDVGDIRGEMLGIFPVLVMTPDKAQIVRLNELNDFTQSHPTYSFLVPHGEENRVQEKIVAQYGGGSDVYPKYNLKRLSEGRQYLEVGVYGDDTTLITMYEASDKEIFPQRVKARWTGSGMLVI